MERFIVTQDEIGKQENDRYYPKEYKSQCHSKDGREPQREFSEGILKEKGFCTHYDNSNNRKCKRKETESSSFQHFLIYFHYVIKKNQTKQDPDDGDGDDNIDPVKKYPL